MFNTFRDAEILYNLRREKRRAKRKAGSGVSTSDDGSTVFSRRSLKKSQVKFSCKLYYDKGFKNLISIPI